MVRLEMEPLMGSQVRSGQNNGTHSTPVFMVLGQSAATAAAQAIDAKAAVQDVEYAELRDRLKADGQVLRSIGK